VTPDDDATGVTPVASEEPEVAAPGAVATQPTKRRGIEWLILVVLTVAFTLLLRTFVIQTYVIPSGSMEQTLNGCTPSCNNDRILVDKLSYKIHSIHRGDIVVFQATGRWEQVVGGEKDIVKRVIGLPGDTVSCCNAGRVVRNGVPLNEPYVYPAGQGNTPFGPITVAKGQLWVMGDHRNSSSDSRYNGTTPESSVIGHAFLRIWPLSRIHTLK
jgi:signal peptidase I